MKEEPFQKCINKNCKKEANLRCPNCKKLGIKEESYFCGKECFISFWNIALTTIDFYILDL